jgi:acyl-CoA synthetase (AMP-forming)/AMP-acid ligase II
MTNHETFSTAADIVAPRRDETIPGLLQAAALHDPDKPFVIFPGHGNYRMTYAATLAGAKAVAGSLQDSGIVAEARIAIYLPNGPAYILAWMGTLLGGKVDVTVNPGLRGAALAYALNKARVDAVITDQSGLAGLATIPESTIRPEVFVLRDEASGDAVAIAQIKWGEWTSSGIDLVRSAKSREATFADTNPLGLASIRFTSGSTGFPKGVMMSQAHMLASAKMFCYMTGFNADDVMYTCFPTHHVFASVTGILSALCAQGTARPGL